MSKSLLRWTMRVYRHTLKLYPTGFRQDFGREMEFVFADQLEESYQNQGLVGLIQVWIQTSIDIIKTSFIQHLLAGKGKTTMKKNQTTLLMSNQIFAWLAAATGLVLSIPLIAMQFSDDVQWGIFDFLIIGCLLFGTGSLFIFIARRVRVTKHRILFGIALLIAVLWLWAELAVGIFTSWGS